MKAFIERLFTHVRPNRHASTKLIDVIVCELMEVTAFRFDTATLH